MEEESYCFSCGEPADLLCDGILGMLKQTRIVDGKVKEALDSRDPTKALFTCDRPLCRSCVRASFPIIFCGKMSHLDTRDYCAQCVEESRIVESGSLLTLEDGHAMQKRRQFHPAPSPTALERAKLRILELESELERLRK